MSFYAITETDIYLAALARRDHEHYDPTLALAAAVLVDGVGLAQTYATARREWRHMRPSDQADLLVALIWVFDDGDFEGFSFTDVCEAIGHNPDHIRRQLLKQFGTDWHELARVIRLRVPDVVHELRRLEAWGRTHSHAERPIPIRKAS